MTQLKAGWVLGLVGALAAPGAMAEPAAPPPAADLVFPADANLARVTDFGATPDDDTDDTAAIQQAIVHAVGVWPKKLVYLPKGTYIVTDTIATRLPDERGGHHDGWRSGVVLIGESRTGTVLKLKDAAEGFGDAAKPKAVLLTGSEGRKSNPRGGGNQAFAHRIRNLTVDVGSGNAGAIGIDFLSSNTGAVENVTIRTSDPERRGAAGLAMNRDWPGPALIKHVEIIGFDAGVQMLDHMQYGMTFEHLTLRHQRRAGFENQRNAAFIRGLVSENAVPALTSSDGGTYVVVDGQLTGSGNANAAITGKGELLARNLTVSGYEQAIDWTGSKREQVPVGRVEEFLSHPPLSLGSSPAGSLDLPVRETPEFHEPDLGKWVRVDGHDADAIQRAIDATIDSDKTVVYLPNRSDQKPRHYTFDKPIIVRGNVRQIVGCGAEIKPVNGLDPATVLFRVEDGPGPVVIEQMWLTGRVEQNSTRDLSLRFMTIGHAGGFNHAASDTNLYNTPRGTGAIFVEDVNAEPTIHPGGTLYARQLNCEFGVDPILENRGGVMWILGFKDEVGKPPIPVLHNGPGAKTEILGLFHYLLHTDQGDTPAVINEGDLSMTFRFNGNPENRVIVREKHGGAWRELLRADAASRFPLYVSRQPIAQGAP
jgi:hypothetical protein